MKKSFKTSVCKAITTVACAAFAFAGALTFNSITAKAETTNFTIDLSNGKCVQFTQDELDLRNLPQSYKDTVAAGLVMEIYDPNLKEFPGIGTTKSVVSQSPYQGICIEQPEGGNVKMTALDGSVGTGKYIISRDAFLQKNFTEDDALTYMYIFYRFTHANASKDPDFFEKMISAVYTVEIKFSDAPVKISKNGNAVSTSFIPGAEIEDNGIKYRVMDASGNLSAIGVTVNSKSITIPDAVNFSGLNLNVTDIAQNFMNGNKKVKKVTIGSNVTSIGSKAFYHCKKLKKVTVNSTKITSIGKKAFGKNAKGFTLKLPKSCKKSYKKMLKKAKIKL